MNTEPFSLACAILFWSTVAVTMVFYLSRPAIFGPLIFAWSGAAIGLSYVTMNFFDLANHRMYFRDSAPPTTAGLLSGLLVGFGVMPIYRKWCRIRPFIEILAVTLLFAGIGATIGATPSYYGNPVPALIRWVLFGAAVGFVAAVVQLAAYRRKKRTTSPECWSSASVETVKPDQGDRTRSDG